VPLTQGFHNSPQNTRNCFCTLDVPPPPWPFCRIASYPPPPSFHNISERVHFLCVQCRLIPHLLYDYPSFSGEGNLPLPVCLPQRRAYFLFPVCRFHSISNPHSNCSPLRVPSFEDVLNNGRPFSILFPPDRATFPLSRRPSRTFLLLPPHRKSGE